MSKIYVIRGVQVMLDVDLAVIYGYTTKRFNEQVKNNIERFDKEERFQLTDAEFKILRSKNRPQVGEGLHPTELADFKREYPNVDITLKPSGGIYHDRYIFIDHGTPNEMIFHCGGSSKDGGRRITSISRVEDVKLYQNIISDLE